MRGRKRTIARQTPHHKHSVGTIQACTNKESPHKAGFRRHHPGRYYSSGTISSATMLMILISGLMAGPAVSL